MVDDQFGDGAAGTRYLEVRGDAHQVSSAVRTQPGLSPRLIRIRPRRVVAWNIDPTHGRLKRQGAGGPLSRFDMVNVLAVAAPDVAVAQVRRAALGPDGQSLPPRR